jgi:exodeoxyribonuclease VII small subunit
MTQNNSKTIQEKITELDELVAWFDSDDFVLETALDKFKQAELLAKEIEQDLSSLKNDITVIKQSFEADRS